MGDDGPLAGAQVPPHQVLADDPFNGRALADPFSEPGLDPSDLTGSQPVASVEDFASQQDDRVPQSIRPDVLGELLEFVLGQLREQLTSRVELESLHAWPLGRCRRCRDSTAPCRPVVECAASHRIASTEATACGKNSLNPTKRSA